MSPVLAFEVILRDDAGPDDALHVIVPVLRALDERIVGTVTVTDVDRQRAELERLRGLLAEAREVLAYVSRGRRYVDVEPCPDALARQVLGAMADAGLR